MAEDSLAMTEMSAVIERDDSPEAISEVIQNASLEDSLVMTKRES